MSTQRDLIEPPEIAGLRAGQSVKDLITFLGKAYPSHLVSDAEPSFDYGKTIFSDATFLEYPQRGLSIRIAEGRVSYILAFSGVPSGYDTDSQGRFEGTLPLGITFSDTFTALMGRFGPPDSGGELSGAPVPSKWMKYHRLGLSLDFVSATGQMISVGVSLPQL